MGDKIQMLRDLTSLYVFTGADNKLVGERLAQADALAKNSNMASSVKLQIKLDLIQHYSGIEEATDTGIQIAIETLTRFGDGIKSGDETRLLARIQVFIHLASCPSSEYP